MLLHRLIPSASSDHPQPLGKLKRNFRVRSLTEPRLPVVGDPPARIVRDLPRMAVRVDEDRRVAAPERLGRLPPHRAPGPPPPPPPVPLRSPCRPPRPSVCCRRA